MTIASDDNFSDEVSSKDKEDSDELRILGETKAKVTNEKKKEKRAAPSSPKEQSSKKKTSPAWQHFEKVLDNPKKAKCNYCGALISCGSSNGTNAMNRHTAKCKKGPFFIDKSQTILDFESRTNVNTDGTVETVSIPRFWHFDQGEVRSALAQMIIIDELPFSFVEREGFRKFCKIGIPKFDIPSRSTITRDCYALFIEKRKNLKNYFDKLSSRVCLTTDTWTSGQNLSYMCLTAHFIDDNWKLHKRIINFCPIAGHSGELIGRGVEKCLLEWGIKRVLTITVDNASSNDLAIKYLKEVVNLWDDCVLNGEFLHMRCAAHILNLVVKDGLKDVDVSILKVRAAVKYVRSSPARFAKFKSCVLEEKIDCKGYVCLDIDTRWNTTFLMLKTAVVFRKAFKNLKAKYQPYVKELRKSWGAPDDDDWDKVSYFLPFLEIFYDATLNLSGSRYVTGNAFVEEIYDIGFTIKNYINDLNVGVKSMAQQMKLKFDKYWSNVNNINVLMFIALVLDPRCKLRYVEWIVRRSYDVDDSYILCEKIRDTLRALFDFYSSSMPSSHNKSCFKVPSNTEISGSKLRGTNLKKAFEIEEEQSDDPENGGSSHLHSRLDPYLPSTNYYRGKFARIRKHGRRRHEGLDCTTTNNHY